ncbi:MAG TPA: hypothetical protein VFK05_09255 [Polyangiaceae bacterium]|nr:hypothetical protein [Polyangiaceae bacterium]
MPQRDFPLVDVTGEGLDFVGIEVVDATGVLPRMKPVPFEAAYGGNASAQALRNLLPSHRLKK